MSVQESTQVKNRNLHRRLHMFRRVFPIQTIELHQRDLEAAQRICEAKASLACA